MRASQLLLPASADRTRSPDPLVRAGLTQRIADGLYTLLPLGRRVLRKLEALFRAEVEALGAAEVMMPLLQPAELWDVPVGAISPAVAFGDQLCRVRGETPRVLAATHEILAARAAAACVRSEFDLPRVVYQVAPRFRDYPGALDAGLLRTREFVMADAYGFHRDPASLEAGYLAMRRAFLAFFARSGLDVAVAVGGPGAIGGDASEEVLAPLPGVAAVAAVSCGCGYAASLEVAEHARGEFPPAPPAPLAEVDAPDGLDPEVLAQCLGVEPTAQLRAIAFVAGARVVLGVVPGDVDLNPAKLAAALSRARIPTEKLHVTSASELLALGATRAWISLVDTPAEVHVVADPGVAERGGFVYPAPRVGRYFVGLRAGRDFRIDQVADLSMAREGAPCPRCRAPLAAIHGTEVAHLFKLGTSYAAAHSAQVLEDGAPHPLWMGAYGVGLTRVMAALALQKGNDRGLVLPPAVAPFAAAVVASSHERGQAAALELYEELGGTDVVLDDRPGDLEARRASLDAIGIPVQLSPRADGLVEVRTRTSGELALSSREQARALIVH